MKEKELRNLIEAHLCENLDEEATNELSDHLSQNSDARKIYLEMSDLHANLAVDESLWLDQLQSSLEKEKVTVSSFKSFIPWALAVCGLSTKPFLNTKAKGDNLSRKLKIHSQQLGKGVI